MERNRHKKENYWISLSDIMTGLMVIFMFIAISYVSQIKQKQKQRDQIVEDYNQIMIDLYNDLKEEFDKDFAENKWNAVLDEDLSIRFLNERVLFAYNSDKITPEFKKILDDFYPRYMSILLNEKYLKNIAEIRIEGHSDSRGEYMYNVNLSQRRTAQVLNYILYNGKRPIDKYSNEEKELIRFWLTANGFSYGRTVDGNGDFTLTSGNPEDQDKSRRVEFRIITKTEDLFKKMVEQLEDGSI